MRERFPDMAILHGCEVDILPGRPPRLPRSRPRALRHRARVAARADAGQSRDQLMRRYVGAMRHPLVAVITHPTNRLVPHRARLRPRLRPPVRDRGRDRARSSRSTARPRTSIWTARWRGAPSPPAPRSRSTATATAPRCSSARCSSASRRRGAAGSSRGTSSTRARSPRSAPSSPASAGADPDITVSRRRPCWLRWASRRWRSRCTARRCCRASISATPDRSRRRSARRLITPRDGYPLYFAIGNVFVLGARRRPGPRAESRVGRGRRRSPAA